MTNDRFQNISVSTITVRKELILPAGVTLPAGDVPAATKTTAGVVKEAAAVANSSATDVATLVSNYNALLASLRAAGILASS